MALAYSIDELKTYLNDVFPQITEQFNILSLRDDGVDVELMVNDSHLRLGGTVSGPTMFGLADVAMYIAVLSQVGPKALAVTTNCSIDFMHKPSAGKNLIAKCRLLKLGSVLAVGDALIFSEGMDKPVARASLTYSIPKK